MKKYLMFACEILRDEITAIVTENEINYPIIYLPPDLHQVPENLQAYMQDTLSRIENVDYVILPMGRCGNGTVGLVCNNATLVLPKCEDCVNLLLSQDHLKVERSKYSMFYTAGWLRNGSSSNNEYLRAVERYGREQADKLMEMLYAHYKYFTLIDTGVYDKEAAYEKLRPLAKIAEVELREIPGPAGVLKKMLTLDLDDNFVLIPPGVAVTPEHLE